MSKEEQRGRSKEDYAKKVWDEFDDFFEFNEQGGDGLRDETKGSDYKADAEINFTDSFKGVKTVTRINSFI